MYSNWYAYFVGDLGFGNMPTNLQKLKNASFLSTRVCWYKLEHATNACLSLTVSQEHAV